jgi:glycosyltransferase involved in cell wall biosynthesis
VSDQAPWPKKRLMLCCFEVPGYGGASTAGYDLFRRMLADGFDSRFLNLIDARDRDFFAHAFGAEAGNPMGLPGVDNITVTTLGGVHPELQRLIDDVAPDLMMGIGSVATAMLRRNAPQRRLVFYTSGCSQAEAMILDGFAADAMGLRRVFERSKAAPRLVSRNEREAFRGADLVIANSTMTQEFLASIFPGETGRIYRHVVWSAEWTYASALRYRSSARPFEQREIDILFVASSWDRAVKNYPMVQKLAARFPHAAIHIAGDVSAPMPRIVHHGLLPNRALIELMGNARTVVCPSLIDSAPGILYEAAAMGCNLVASRNCGNWSLCHPDLLAARCSVDAFAECIARALTRSYPDNIASFLNPGSYADLIETLMVM